MRLILIVTLLSVIFSCSDRSVSNVPVVRAKDTLKFIGDLSSINDTNLRKPYESYSERHGLIIQDYYQIIDSLAIDLNSDNVVDEVLVISPLSLDDPAYNNPKIDADPKRLLVEVVNKGGVKVIRNKNSNLISNGGGVLFSFLGITKTKEGFSLMHGAGNKARWTYSVELSVEDPNILSINKISKECAYEDGVKNFEYNIKNISLIELNIQDTIKNNCNCDKAWEELMKAEH